MRLLFWILAVLRFSGVSKRYFLAGQAVDALRSVSIEIAAGEFTALTGRSGCGKSTFLNLAGAMDFPTSGSVAIDGRRTEEMSEAELTALRRGRVGFVFQFFQLLPTLSAVENVELPLQLAGERRARARALEALELVEAAALADRMPHQLSGGQMQRAAIARALAHSPSVVLADEPIGNLDSESAEDVMRLLRRIADELRTTVVMATHSLESAAAADRVVALRDGRIETAVSKRTPTDLER